MKVARVGKDVHHVPQNERAKCFREYPSLKALRTDLIKPTNLWVVYDYSQVSDGRFHRFRNRQKRRYEDFISGFLYHHDLVNDGIEKVEAEGHVFYIDWDDSDQKVRIYLTPLFKPVTESNTSSTAALTDPVKPPAPPPPSMIE